MTRKSPRRQSSVPTSRLGRFLRFGLMAGGLVAGGLVESLRRFKDAGSLDDTLGAFFNARSARRLAWHLSHLRGAAMKLGQLLSLEGEDLLPPEVVEALAILRADANPMPLAQLKRLLGREYGKGWQRRFVEFDFEPVAAASIGQVHRVRAADGRDLALKIQYPGVARSIDSDVANVAMLLRMLNFFPMDLDISGLEAEAKRQLHQEADYFQETRFLNQYRELVADEPGLWVPRAHADLTTKRILAMDFAKGMPLEALAGLDIPQERRDAAGGVLERLLFRELFEFRLMQTDPNFANYLYDPASGRIILLDFGSVRGFSGEFIARYAHICRAIMAGDRAVIQQIALDIGYLGPDCSKDQADSIIDLIMLVCEPLRLPGPYDFAQSQLASRARAFGLDLALRRGYLRGPPAETVFLHRKLVGSFFILARLRARVDVQALILPFLQAGCA